MPVRLLVLTPELPYPPRGGARLRNFYLIKHLAQEHEVHLLSFAQSEASQAEPGPLAEICAGLHVVPRPRCSTTERLRWLTLSGQPDLAIRLYSPVFAARLDEMLNTHAFDAVQVEGLEMAPYYLRRQPGKTPPVLLDEHNAEYVLQRRAFAVDAGAPARWKGAAYSLVQWRRLVAYERRACRRARLVIAVSERDRQALLALDTRLSVDVVANGLDCAHYAFRAQQPLGNPPSLLFTGVMDFRPNVDAMLWFCREVLPLLRQRMPEVRLIIAGRGPAPMVRALAEPGVTVTGEVDDDLPYFAQAAAYIVPLRMGGGTRFKVLQAMASGVPVVSTACGAEGIAARDGEHLLLADTAEAFAGQIARLLKEPALGERLRQAGRHLVERDYDWRVIAPKLLAIYGRWQAEAP
ncbi:MAG: glycosyltransferase [Chloroflexi bacterium]|nr:glycosyltransferase [Chloroflexota bacterium]